MVTFGGGIGAHPAEPILVVFLSGLLLPAGPFPRGDLGVRILARLGGAGVLLWL